MKKIIFIAVAMLFMVGGSAMAQRRGASAKGATAKAKSMPVRSTFNPAQLKAALMDQLGVDEAELKEGNTQYLLVDIDKDGKQEILVKYQNSVNYIFTQAHEEPEILIEKTSPDEFFSITENGMVVSTMEKSYMNVTTIYKIRRSNISDSATSSIEHIEKQNADGETEYDEKVDEGPNYKKLEAESGKSQRCYDMQGWVDLCK